MPCSPLASLARRRLRRLPSSSTNAQAAVNGLGNRWSPCFDVDRDGKYAMGGIGAGERIGSDASIRTGLYGVQLRRTDINGRR